MISFIVPAHNEQAVLGWTLQAIHDSARIVGQPYEIIVVNDASTDATAEVARQNNATVLSVSHRQIAATRNSGGRAARGERLFFIDADTTANPQAIASALRAMDKGAAGGGAPTWPGDAVPLYVWLLALVYVIPAKLAGFTGGAFMFSTREAFHASGGFDERLYWGEEGSFALALKRVGRFVVIWEPVRTSGRRFRTMSGFQVLTTLGRACISPFKMFTRRSSVEKIWYDSNREHDDKIPNGFTVKIANTIAFVVVLVLVTGPLWNFIPHSLTPRDSPIGKVRFIIGIFLCHVALIFWPFALILFRSLLKPKHWLEWLKLTALFAFLVWQAWGATNFVIRVWADFIHWLAHF
jgi:glycosyltransferase involved in cell wall biosynthesis